jgi:hypothetical protein
MFVDSFNMGIASKIITEHLKTIEEKTFSLSDLLVYLKSNRYNYAILYFLTLKN